jgi:hypothetical protein
MESKFKQFNRQTRLRYKKNGWAVDKEVDGVANVYCKSDGGQWTKRFPIFFLLTLKYFNYIDCLIESVSLSLGLSWLPAGFPRARWVGNDAGGGMGLFQLCLIPGNPGAGQIGCHIIIIPKQGLQHCGALLAQLVISSMIWRIPAESRGVPCVHG